MPQPSAGAVGAAARGAGGAGEGCGGPLVPIAMVRPRGAFGAQGGGVPNIPLKYAPAFVSTVAVYALTKVV